MSANQSHEVVLEGCAPTPLASYLKALGVLRLLGEQKPEWAVRGAWREDRFVLKSPVFSGDVQQDRQRLQEFFLDEYRPTPIVAPWGARSGFYPGSSENSAREALNSIVGADEKGVERVFAFASAIKRVRDMLIQHGFSDKPKDEDKLMLLRICRAEFPDEELAWLDSCYVLTADDRQFPPLLGTGGNEGSGSYVSGYAQQVVACIVHRKHDAALIAGLFADAVPASTSDQTFGQFSPEAAGGVNMGAGFSGDSTTNPWDYLLALEGTLAFSSATTRRLDCSSGNQFAFPFTVQMSTVGHGGLANQETDKSRAEIWLPLWNQSVRWNELRVLLAEGRVTVGRRPARDGLQFAMGIAKLGLDRGLTSFQRHVIVERLGQNNLAIPLQKIVVNRNPDIDLIEQLESGQFLDRLREFARKDEAPARIRSRIRQFEDALFELAQRSERRTLQNVIIHLGALSQLLGKSTKGREAVPMPVPTLSEEWVLKADDGSPEFRMAAALAGLGGMGMPMRPFLSPVQHEKDGRWGWDAESRLAVWGEGDLAGNMGRVIDRRRLESLRQGDETTPFQFFAGVSSGDVAAWLNGEVDEARFAGLLSGLVHVRIPEHLTSRSERAVLPAAYSVLKPFFTPMGLLTHFDLLPPDRKLPLPGELVTRLQSGDVQKAVEIAWRRLHAVGYPLLPHPNKPPLAHGLSGPRLLAALAVPLALSELAQCLRTMTRKPTNETV